MKATSGRLALCVRVLVAAGFSSLLQAQSVRDDGAIIELGMGAEHTNNAYKNMLFERSEMKEYLDLDLGFLRRSDVFVADVRYDGELSQYEHNTTDDDSVIQGHADISWQIVPGRLKWDMGHERSEQLQDSRNPDIRSNRELRNIITAGPTFTARMSPVDSLVFNGTYYDVSYDDSDRGQQLPGQASPPPSRNSDSERLQGAVAWEHRLSKTDVLSLSYQNMQTDFSDDVTEDLEFQRLFGTYAVELASGGYTVSLGVNSSERDSGDESEGFLAQIGWRLETGGHRFRLNVVNELTDSSIGLGSNSLVNDDFRPGDENFGVVDMVERSTFAFNYGFDRLCERCTVDVGLASDEQDFDVQPRDQEAVSMSGSFRYRLTSLLTARLRARLSETQFTQDDRTDDRTEYALLLDWRLSRPLTASMWLNWDERDSDSADADYDELFGGVSFTYKFR